MVARRVPLDLILEILNLLPAKSVLRFMCVCKEWYNLINTPLFAKLHVNKSLEPDSRHNRILICNTTFSIYIVDDLYYHPLKLIKLNWPKDTIRHDDRISIVGSCNGLVCLDVSQKSDLSYSNAKCFLICNPTTRTFKLILPFSEKKWTNDSLSYGFGYDSDHDDYKIVVTRYWLGETNRYVYIYSLKTDLWSCSYPPTRVSTERFWAINGKVIFGNNMLHYLVSSEIGGVTKDYRIARFDVVSEKWRDDLSLPVPVLKNNNYVGLRKLDGWLCLHVGNFGVNSSDVWMMEEYGSWKKTYHLPRAASKQWLIARLKDGCHSLLVHEYDGNKDYWYDQRDNTMTSFTLKRLPEDRQTFMLCIASLVAIPGCSFTKLQQVEHEA